MGQTRKLGTTATSVRSENGATHVRYHQTDVVSFNAHTITLRTGGWKTATTKSRMNQAAHQFGLKYGVSQRKGQWYVSRWNAETYTGFDEKPFNPTGVHTFTR